MSSRSMKYGRKEGRGSDLNNSSRVTVFFFSNKENGSVNKIVIFRMGWKNIVKYL